MEHKNTYLIKCRELIESKLNWGASGSWHNDMFTELSDLIQQETKVLLSPITLKRVWGRIDYKGDPSITTLNTLAQFAGFTNWRDFKGTIPHSDGNSNRIGKKVRSNLGVIMVSASVMTLVFISFYSLRGPETVKPNFEASQVTFTSEPVVEGLPNSVVFNVDLGEIQNDSILIQQFWDPTKTISIKPGQKQATGQYYFPGYFRAKLLVDGAIVKQHDLFIKSQGWLGTIDHQPVPKYFKNLKMTESGLQIPNSAFEEIVASEKPIRFTYHMVKEFDAISGDNFELNTILKNTYKDVWAVCQKSFIIVLGTKGALVISLGIPGCSSELWVMMNDTFYKGTEHDLSGLGLDFSDPREIKIRVEERNLKVLHQSKTLFSGKYQESIGRIAGLRYRFIGAGEVHQSILSDLEGKTVVDFMEN